jgi:uncharacterized RDD family membrane protein YckC
MLAGAIDIGCLLAWAAIITGGYWLLQAWLPPLNTIAGQAALGAAVGIPALACFAAWESGRKQGTPGKQRYGLRVHGRRAGERVGFGRALVRNAAKIALPVFLAHQGLVAFPPAGIDGWTLAAVAVLLPVSYVVEAVVGNTAYDILAGTRVTERAGRALADPAAAEPDEVAPAAAPRRAW